MATRPGRGRVFARGGMLWIDYDDETGRRRRQSTGLRLGQEREAERILRAVLRRVEEGVELGGPLTVRRWAEEWIDRRERRGIAMVRDERQRLRTHIGPALGDILLEDLTRRQVVRWVDGLRSRLAPRSVLHIYGTLRQMMAAAVREGLIQVTPCTLVAGEELPRLEDADPEWRHGAVYTREEVELLISHPDIPEDRRLGYALMALGGLRWGEVAALRWRAYDQTAEPLGCLTVALALSDRRRKKDGDGIGRTKTGAVRQVPVHPTLAALLAAWRLRTQPSPDDLIITTEDGRPVTQPRAYRRLQGDLERIGLRRRRLHDLRRTMISLAQADGAQPATLRWITHTPSRADMIASYTTLPWATLCEAVACMRVQVRQGEVVPLRAAAGAEDRGTPGAQRSTRQKKAPQIQRLAGHDLVGDAGFEPADRRSASVRARRASSRNRERIPERAGPPHGPGSASLGTDCAPCAPESQVRAAVERLDPAEARAILLRVLADLG